MLPTNLQRSYRNPSKLGVCVCVCVCDEIVLLVDLTVIPCAQYFQRCFVVVPPRPCLFAVIPKL